jgi:hypothetical protein
LFQKNKSKGKQWLPFLTFDLIFENHFVQEMVMAR